MRRFFALLCAAVLCLGLLPAPANAVGEVYFTAVNDRLRPLSDDTMPVWVNGVLYVPATVFDSSTTGVSLGLYCSRKKDGSTVSLYDLQRMLVFDLEEGASYNQHTGERYEDRAFNRGGQIFLPLAAVCRFFALEYSYTYTEYGYLVRVKSDRAVLTDVRFIDAASSVMSKALKDYRQSQTVVEPPREDEPVVPPPSAPPEVEPDVNVQLCLAFRCETGENLSGLLDRLQQTGCRGLFLLPGQVLLEQDDLVRRILGSGHSIGLVADGESVQGTREELVRCNTLLKHAARTAATIALVPEEQRAALTEEGWVCWQESLEAALQAGEKQEDYLRRLIDAIGTRQRTLCLTLDDSEATVQVLEPLLERLREEHYAIITPLETKL